MTKEGRLAYIVSLKLDVSTAQMWDDFSQHTQGRIRDRKANEEAAQPSSSVSDKAMFNTRSSMLGHSLNTATLDRVISRVVDASPSQWSRETVVSAPLFGDLPDAILAQAKEAGYDTQGRNDQGYKVSGVTYQGVVYLVQGNISSELEAEETLLHERVHHILQNDTQDPKAARLRNMLDNLYLRMDGLVGITIQAKRLGLDISGPLADRANVAKRNQAAFITEEFLAHAEGMRAYGKLADRWKLNIREFWGEFRKWLRSSGFVKLADDLGMRLADFTQSDLAFTLKGIRESATGSGSKAIRFMTAYHGSPHDHNQFSTAHIGSGEGAHIYGWGLYFAGNKEVAEYYRDNLSLRNGSDPTSKKINGKTLMKWYEHWENKADTSDYPQEFYDRMQMLEEAENSWNVHSAIQKGIKDSLNPKAIAWFKSVIVPNFERPGKTYEVELAPKESEYLDWDKPIQSEDIRDAFRQKAAQNTLADAGIGVDLLSLDGNEIYSRIAQSLGQKQASEFLLSLGIRGIRYLDDSSRGANGGSSNYVIFNDADVSITAKFSRQRADVAETAADRHARLAAESNAKKAARQTGPVVPLHTKTADEQTINEAGGIRDAQVVGQNKLPNANQANGGVSRQAADFISTVARLFNKRVVWFTSASLKADGLWTLGDTLFINARSQTAPLRVLGHELTHAMERESPKAYAQMMQSVQHLLTDEQLMDQHSDYFGESLADAQALDAPYQGTTMREFLAKEWMADLSGNRFSETSFWNDLFTGIEAQHGSATAKSIVTRLRMAFLNVLAKLKSFVQGQAYGVDARLADHLEAIRLAVKDGFIAYEQAAKQGTLAKGKNGVNFSQASKIPSGIVSVVPILTQNITGVDHPVSNKQLREISDGLLQSLRIEMAAGKSPLVNRQTGWQFSISANDARKMGNNPHMKPESSKAVVYARELISAAILAETHADTQGHQSEAVHRFYAPALIDGKLYRVRLTVLDYQESSGKRNLHAIQAVEIENALPGTLPATDTSVDAVTLAQPTTGRTISIDQLLQGAKREDGSLFSRQRTALGPLTPEQTAAAQHVLGTPKTLLQRLQDFKKDWAMNLKQGIFNQFAPIMALNPQAYWLARLSKGGDSTLEALMMYGKLSLGADGSTQVQYTKAGGLQGFAPQMAKLKGEHDRFFLWVAALRADRLKGIGLENLWSVDDITHLKTLNAGAMLDGTMRPPLYAAALQQLNDFNDNILEIAEKSGLIDADTRQLYKDQPYIPFYRLNEDDQVNGFNIKPGLVNQTAWKKLKGGTDKLNEDLMANLLQNWSHLITASAKNRAAKATLKAAAAIGVAESIPSGAPGKGHVSYREGGKEKAFILSDPHLMDAVAALHYAGLGDLAKPFTLAKYFLTIGVTANPAFKIRNLIRDTLASIGTSSLSTNPARNLKQGWTATAKESETRAQMMAGGGMIRFGSMLDGKNSQRAKDLIHEGVLPEHILDSPSKIAQFWKKTGRPALNAYNELGDRLEQVNRAALYEQLLAKGISPAEAAFQARDLMDFQMGGQWAAVRLLTQTVPFMNARLQGLYKLGRATKEDYKRVGTVVGAVALASLALLLAYQDDEDWKARSEADRNNYWWFKVDGKAYRVPKPFEIGAIGTLAERGYEKMFDPEMTNKRFGGVMRDLVMSQLSMNPVPQLVKPLADIYANKDNFSGAPIEGLGMEKLKKADRLTPKTSEVARFLGGLGLPNPAQLAMGRWESLSPVQIDYLAKAYFSWLGTMTTTVLDYGIRPMMNRGERPEMKLKDVFLVGNFVESLPASGSRYVTQMYDQAKEIEQAYSSYKHLLKLGDLAGAKEALAEDHDLIVRYPATEALKELESKISAQMRRVEASTTMSPAQKRIQLDTLTTKRNQVALNFKAR